MLRNIQMLTLSLILFTAVPLAAQAPGAAAHPLTGPQKRTLLLIAREAVEAAREGRLSREPTVEPRLTLAQPLVVSLYLDGRLRARAWRLKNIRPLYLEARELTYMALASPKVGEHPLRPDELARVEVGLAFLSGYAQARSEADVPPRSAVIIYHRFTEWLALPGDIKSDRVDDLLAYACQQAGLWPGVWLLPQTTIYSAQVEQIRENSFDAVAPGD